MTEFKFTFKLGRHGWASVVLGNEEAEVERTVSYISHPLQEMAALACYLLEDEKWRLEYYKSSIDPIRFEDEPGELIFRVTQPAAPDSTLEYEVSEENGMGEEKVLFTGSVRYDTFAEAIFHELKLILERHGFAAFRERWVRFEFPLEEYARLATLIGHRELQIPLVPLASLEGSKS
jgi:hypothetical protein